jgi:hypothetical protein
MGCITSSVKSLISPAWKMMAIGQNFDDTFSAVKDLGEGGACIFLFCLPFAITGGAITGELTEHQWQPTIQGLQQGLQESDPAILLDSAFETMLSQYGGSKAINLNQADDPFAQAKQQGLKSIFQTEILKIEMNECGTRGLFGFAITLRTRLWETASKTLLYDLVSQYSNTALRRKKSLFYEFYETEMKGKGTECRKMEAYGGAEVGKLLTEEISKAIQASIQRFFDDVVKKKSQ